MKLLPKIFHLISDNQIMIVLLALIAGVIFPEQLKFLNAYTTYLLTLIFLVSSFRINPGELTSYLKDWKMLSVANFVMLIFMPLAMWLPTWVFAPDWALAFLIVGAAPTGLTIALVADLFGGRQALAMLIAVTTSLIAPLTMPLLLYVVVGQSVKFPVGSMLLSLIVTMVVPFFAAMAVKHKFPKFINRNDAWWREISLILFGILVAGVTADSMAGSARAFNPHDLGTVLVMVAFMGGIAWFSYAITPWRTASERITIALCMVYMNNTVALYIGDRFFAEQNVVTKLIIILTAVNLLLPPLKWAAAKAIKGSGRGKRLSVKFNSKKFISS
ncbi:MAG: bile acid:sodium symporter [Patescibacteria group bacterium]|nr:bile acid:sodium symporter [Patescibacteria group bacterium]